MLGVARRPGSSELEEYFWEDLVKLIVLWVWMGVWNHDGPCLGLDGCVEL